VATAYTPLIADDNKRSTHPLSGGRCIQGEVEWLKIARLDHVAVDNPAIQYSIPV
jgi:hypothetical protein